MPLRKEPRNIIIESKGEQIGLLVDGIKDVVATTPENMEPAPANLAGVHGKFFRDAFKTDNALIGILDIETVLEDF